MSQEFYDEAVNIIKPVRSKILFQNKGFAAIISIQVKKNLLVEVFFCVDQREFSQIMST